MRLTLQFLALVTCLVLSAPRAQRGVGQGEKSVGFERTLQQEQVAKGSVSALRRALTLYRRPRQQQHGQVRPQRLLAKVEMQGRAGATVQAGVGDDRQAYALFQGKPEVFHGGGLQRLNAGLVEQALGQLAELGRRQNQRSFGIG
ncbi:hypothetical protein D9M71_522480 [compost metagenome]